MSQNKLQFSVKPKRFYWVEAPILISKLERIELLKKDLWLEYISLENLDRISKIKSHKIILFNLDSIIMFHKSRLRNSQDIARNLAQSINSLSIKVSLVHAEAIDNQISKIFKNQGIPYIQKKFETSEIVMQTLYELSNTVFSNYLREYLRIKFINFYEISVKIYRDEERISAFLKNISLNGACLVIKSPPKIKNFLLKEALMLEIHINNFDLQIKKAFITRISSKELEIGINFLLDKEEMINQENASLLSKQIYTWVSLLIRKEG